MGLFMKMIALAIAGSVLGVVGWFFLQGLQDVSLDEFRITGVRDVSAQSFTLVGVLGLNNPSATSVPIKEVTYHLVLKETGEVIGSGVLPAFTLTAGQVTNTAFEQEVFFAPAASTLARLAGQDKVLVVMRGTVVLSVLEAKTIPFEDEVDIKAAILAQSPPENEGSGPLPVDGLLR